MIIRRLFLLFGGSLSCMPAAMVPTSFEQDFALIDPALLHWTRSAVSLLRRRLLQMDSLKTHLLA